MDSVFVRSLTVSTIVGVYPEERTSPQRVIVSFELFADTRAPARSDDISDALDYGEAAQQVAEFVRASRYELIEALADGIASLLLDGYTATKVVVEVLKPGALADAQTVGVRIERSRG
ncbi:MAG: dihydroneopterin aldolase [Pseudomonadales bacterium]|nr:dihydroneopterin aldolase [Pseudomonadales bacterium]NIX08551.1 dihydroneopterin aldolase [Pseudomonadales bacterium]